MLAKNRHNIEKRDLWAEVSVFHKTHKVGDSRGLKVMVVVKYRNILGFLGMGVNLVSLMGRLVLLSRNTEDDMVADLKDLFQTLEGFHQNTEVLVVVIGKVKKGWGLVWALVVNIGCF